MPGKLSPQVQLAIVKELACYQTPTEVVETLRQERGIEISRQAVRYYNPTQNPQLAPHLVQLFNEQRRTFQTQIDAIAIESRVYRQQCRLRLWLKNQHNPQVALSILDSAAKEAGGAYGSKAPNLTKS
jgi:hypothetical protein